MATPEEVQAKVDEVLRQYDEVCKQNEAIEKAKEEFARSNGVTLEEVKEKALQMIDIVRDNATAAERIAFDAAISELDAEQDAHIAKYETKVDVVPRSQDETHPHHKRQRSMV